MDVLKIKGALYTQKRTSKEAVSPLLNKKVILQDNTPVFKFIDNSGADGNSIHKIKVAREILFDFEVYLKHKPTGKVVFMPQSLSELISYIDEKDLSDYSLVLNTEDKDILSEIIQQMLYLDIDIEIMLKNEEIDRREMEFFSEIFDDLKKNLEDIKRHISFIHGELSIAEDRNAIIKTLSDIEDMLIEMHRKDLKVAIMSLKKSGKSMLVNCLIGEEYAPASTELPTFNSCIYKRSKNNIISLNYQGQQLIFKNPTEIKEYILDEFRNAHSNKKGGYMLDDMEINYVSGANSLCNYTIIDTPGPDLAGSDHKNVAYKWIGEVDVVLFIVDYTKHLTKSEEDFFRDIKEVFERHNKIYSFIVVVNKLDLMYLSEEKKSAVRFIDFLRYKLKELGYSGFIVLGISALQYFYAQKVLQIKECTGLDTDDRYMLRECLDATLKRYQGKEEMTILSFIDNQIRNLLWFHGIDGATLKTLKEKSGVEQLIKYINYIAVEKASVEMFRQKVSLIDQRLSEMKDNIFCQIVKLQDRKKHLETEILEVMQFYEEAMTAIKEKVTFVKDMSSIERDINLAHKSMLLIINTHINNMMKRLSKALSSLSKEEIILLQNGNNLSVVDDIFSEIKKGVIEKNYLQVLSKYEKYINTDISEKEKAIHEQNRLMQSKVMKYNEYIKHIDEHNIHIAIPKLPPSFSSFDFSPIVMKLNSTIYCHLFKGRLARGRGFTGTLLLILSLGRINHKTGRFKFDDVKLRKALFLIRKGLEEYAQKWIAEHNALILSHIERHFNILDKEISDEREDIVNKYKSLFDNIINELKYSMEIIQVRIEFLEEVGRSMELFCDLWNKFRSKRLLYIHK